MLLSLIISLIGVFIISIIAHELGHMVMFQNLKNKSINPEIKFYYDSWRKFGFRLGEPKDYDYLTKGEYNQIIFAGIFSGFMVIMLPALMNDAVYALLLPAYFMGCMKDIEILYKFNKK